ncbi:MAG: DoxX family protein [Ramlibacter sp.]|nr:DoxX family protein [Ramlibacter sp.]
MNPSQSAQDALTLVGRVFIAWLFIPEGIHQMTAFAGTAGYIASKGLPLAEVAVVASIFAHVGLGLAVLVGWQARWAALGLAIFVAVITPIFHNYWALPEAQQMMQKISFNKNIAIIGGLLLLTAFGAGRFSLDARRR